MTFGGCCLIDDHSLPPLSATINVDDLPPRFQRGGRTSGSLVKQFISQAVDFLGTDTITAREAIKDALGMDLHPVLFPALFTYIDV